MQQKAPPSCASRTCSLRDMEVASGPACGGGAAATAADIDRRPWRCSSRTSIRSMPGVAWRAGWRPGLQQARAPSAVQVWRERGGPRRQQ